MTNVYKTFLTTKVKVFATEKGVKPFTKAKKYINKAYPFLLCSAIVYSSCAQPKANSAQSEEKHPHQEQPSTTPVDIITNIQPSDVLIQVQNTEDNIDYSIKVPFSKQEIMDLMENPNPPSLYDLNYNHRAENQENFWTMVRNGLEVINTTVQNSARLTDEQKKEYKITAFKLLSQISKYKGSENEVDLTDPSTEKLFIYTEKVFKHKDNYNNVLKREPGISDERTEFLGRYYKDFKRLVEIAEDNPNIEEFAKALYENDERFIFTPQDTAQANIISRKIYEEWKQKQHITDDNLYRLVKYAPEDSLLNKMSYNFLRGDDCFALIEIEQKGRLNYGKVAPIWSLVIHELQHLAQKEPASNEAPEDNQLSDSEASIKNEENNIYDNSYLGELGPTLSSLARDDQIFKKIYKIEPDAIVDYGVMLRIGVQEIPLGEIAVWWKNIEQRYQSNSVDDLLCKPEVTEQINTWCNEPIDSNTSYKYMMIQADRIR